MQFWVCGCLSFVTSKSKCLKTQVATYIGIYFFELSWKYVVQNDNNIDYCCVTKLPPQEQRVTTVQDLGDDMTAARVPMPLVWSRWGDNKCQVVQQYNVGTDTLVVSKRNPEHIRIRLLEGICIAFDRFMAQVL